MKGRFLLRPKEFLVEGNIYANRSSVVLSWLLKKGLVKEEFSLREASKNTGVSIGLVQRIFAHLIQHGVIHTTGVRTAKRFFMKKPDILLKNWIAHYDIVKKCKMWTYRSGFKTKEELLKALKQSHLLTQTAFALHSAAEIHGYKNTNLNTLELYMLEPDIKEKLENALNLIPQERGYEVLLIEPYYKSLLNLEPKMKNLCVSSSLLTFLDLYHFPLRGLEQAEFMIQRAPELKSIHRKIK